MLKNYFNKTYSMSIWCQIKRDEFVMTSDVSVSISKNETIQFLKDFHKLNSVSSISERISFHEKIFFSIWLQKQKEKLCDFVFLQENSSHLTNFYRKPHRTKNVFLVIKRSRKHAQHCIWYLKSTTRTKLQRIFTVRCAITSPEFTTPKKITIL